MSPQLLQLTADLILTAHVVFVAFVVGGLLLVLIGALRHWRWVRNPWFRLTHLLAIGCVVLQSWLGRICPLTTWEMTLRARSGDQTYSGSFVAHWLSRLLYYDFPPWVFILAYSTFAALVLASWLLVPPRPFKAVR